MGSKPRTYSKLGSGETDCPQPLRWPDPLTARSAAPIGLFSENETFARCGIRNFARSNESDSDAFELHGPRQLFRVAICPSCFSRHARVPALVFARSWRIPDASAESPAMFGE